MKTPRRRVIVLVAVAAVVGWWLWRRQSAAGGQSVSLPADTGQGGLIPLSGNTSLAGPNAGGSPSASSGGGTDPVMAAAISHGYVPGSETEGPASWLRQHGYQVPSATPVPTPSPAPADSSNSAPSPEATHHHQQAVVSTLTPQPLAPTAPAPVPSGRRVTVTSAAGPTNEPLPVAV